MVMISIEFTSAYHLNLKEVQRKNLSMLKNLLIPIIPMKFLRQYGIMTDRPILEKFSNEIEVPNYNELKSYEELLEEKGDEFISYAEKLEAKEWYNKRWEIIKRDRYVCTKC